MRWEGEDVDAVVGSAELLSALAIELRKCCANLQISMIRIRQRALDEIERSKTYWAGPNAELFRKSAKLYIDGTLDVPRRQVRSMPIGLAREYTSGLIDKLKNFERDLNTCVGNFKTSAAALSAVREELARKKSELESATKSNQRHLDFYSSANMESVFLRADIERLQEQEATDVKAVLKCYQELKMIGSKFKDFSDESRSELVKCSREMSRQNSHMQEIVNRLRFEVLWHGGEIELPNIMLFLVWQEIVPSPKDVLAGAKKEVDFILAGDIASGVMMQVPTKAGDLPGFAKSWKPVQEHLDKFPKGSRNFRAFSGAIMIAYASLETLKDMSDSALEKHVWTEFVKQELRLPDGIFEKFFKPGIDAEFRSNKISQGLMNVFKALAVFGLSAIPGGLVAAIAVGIAASVLVDAADKTYVETEQDRELERKLKFAVEMGFRNWRAAEDKEGAINPLLYSAKNKF